MMEKNDLYKIKIQDKFGFINQQGDIVIEPYYKSVNDFSEGVAYVWTFDDKEGYINNSNKWVIELNADFLGDFEYGMAIVIYKGKYGCINKQGEFVIEPIYERIYAINSENSVIAEKKGKVGVFGISNQIIIEPIFDVLGTFSDGLALAKQGSDFGFINDKGEQKIAYQYKYVSNFSEGLAEASIDGERYGFINKQGEFHISPNYYQVSSFSEGLAGFKLKANGKWGYIDSLGNVVIKNKFQSVGDFNSSLAVVESKDMYGYIDKQGEYLLKNVFTTADPFYKGLGCVTFNGEWGYVDTKGSWIFKSNNF
ncbi:WG repeat-containing protein [Paenibacillus sp. DCT19]|uniref:WG repeat-containing protein n=1 Tax=Paenibacillus sp. DCT19 TaxID=2211212 RepID=UPI0013E352D6|nr:WG repeat-containing protein [Paenibacillus sp. DCT19]